MQTPPPMIKHLTLTSVVFESEKLEEIEAQEKNLTLTSVVFEW